MTTPWHCTTDHVTWPGCGTCGPCRQAAVEVFEAARSLRGVVQAARDECSSFGAHTFTVDGRLVVEVSAILAALAAAADAPPPEPAPPTKCASCGRPKNAHSPTRTGGYLTGHRFIDPKDVCGHTVEEGCTGHGDF